MVNFTAVIYGMAVSAIAPNVEAASAIATPLLIIGILFGGFYISVGNLPIVANWVPYFSFPRWGFEALTINEYKGLTFSCKQSNSTCILTGEQELQILTFDGHTTSYPVFGLGMVLLGYLFVSYWFLLSAKMSYLALGHTGKGYLAKLENISVASGEYERLEKTSTLAADGKIIESADEERNSKAVELVPLDTPSIEHEEVYVNTAPN
jgi:hypothetical protein